MVKDYYPFDIEKTYEFIQDECENRNNISTQEIIYDLLDDRFCKYIYINGKNKNKMCLSYIKNIKSNSNYKNFCFRHKYVAERTELRKKIKEQKIKTRTICKYKTCRNIAKDCDLCKKHIKQQNGDVQTSPNIHTKQYSPTISTLNVFNEYLYLNRLFKINKNIFEETLNLNLLYEKNVKKENITNITFGDLDFIIDPKYENIKNIISKNSCGVDYGNKNLKNNINNKYIIFGTIRSDAGNKESIKNSTIFKNNYNKINNNCNLDLYSNFKSDQKKKNFNIYNSISLKKRILIKIKFLNYFKIRYYFYNPKHNIH